MPHLGDKVSISLSLILFDARREKWDIRGVIKVSHAINRLPKNCGDTAAESQGAQSLRCHPERSEGPMYLTAAIRRTPPRSR
jgi:hypothetical protein